jgi:hypothetical protein
MPWKSSKATQRRIQARNIWPESSFSGHHGLGRNVAAGFSLRRHR